MQSSSSIKVWIRLDTEDDNQAEEVVLPIESTISSLKTAIVTLKLYSEITFVKAINQISHNSKVLNNRQRLSEIIKTENDEPFVVFVHRKKTAPAVPGAPMVQLPGATRPDHSHPVAARPDKSAKYSLFFDITRKEILSETTGKVEEYRLVLRIKDKALKEVLKNETGGNLGQLYEQEPEVEAYQLVVFLNQLKDRSEALGSTHPLALLVEWISDEYGNLTSSIEEMLKDGVITFGTLWYIFPKGTKIFKIDNTSDAKVGSEVSTFQYKKTIFNELFAITATVIQINGTKLISVSKNFYIPQFNGTRKLTELPVRKMDDKVFAELQERGKRFLAFGRGVNHMSYKGTIFRKSFWSVTYFKADGRVIIDDSSFRRMNPNYRHEDYSSSTSGSQNTLESITEENYYKTWPTVLGFSFAAKKWGEINIENISPVVFDDLAFSRLVLDHDSKDLIKSLVENKASTFKDIVTGKGGGCIILLHGSPGVGKTLTAEAIAELLHKPLYSISVGELGTNTEQLENTLREILEVASTWDAVILIDEADIFLEKRSENDITRNAMVGIFLRLLEYHQGVLFLTTNRVKTFDKAFHSRISIALKYEDLNNNAREQVWKNFLEFTGINGIELDKLVKYDLNGRQIKNIIRLALSLANAQNQKTAISHFMTAINATIKFQEDILLIEKSKE